MEGRGGVKQSTSARGLYLRLYKTARKCLQYAREPRFIRYDWDVHQDYRKTKAQLGFLGATSLPPVNRSREVLIVSMTELPVLLKFHGLLALGLRTRNYHPLLLLPSRKARSLRYLKLFGLGDHNILAWTDLVREYGPSLEEVTRVVDGLLAEAPGIPGLKQLQYRGVFVGKHALSSAIRTRLRRVVDVTSPDQRQLIRQKLIGAVESVGVAQRLLSTRPIQKMIVRDAGYVPNGGIYEVGLLNGVDCVRGEMGQMLGHWLLKRYDLQSRGQALFSMSEATWKRLWGSALTSGQGQELDANFRDRYDPSSTVDLYRYQDGKRPLSPEEVRAKLSLDPRRKTAVVFSHISWDASFFDGEDLFDDYEQWLVETVRVAVDNPRLNWIVKLHPANQYKLKAEDQMVTRETEMEALAALGPLPGHIKILHADTEINTQSLFPLTDYGVTVRGTIGMELPCLGIPVVTAGTGRYDGYGFTLDSSSREQYENRLRALERVPRLSADQIEMARRHAYWSLIARQVSFEDVAPATSMPHGRSGHPLFYNVGIRARSPEEIANAASMRAFLDWFLESDEPDFMRR